VVPKLSRKDMERLLQEHSAAASPGFLLWRASLRWQRVISAALKEEGLTHVQFLILSSVWWFERDGHEPSQRDVSEHASLDRVMMSQVCRQLEVDGLLTRTVDPIDGRIRRLATTSVGRHMAERCVALMDAADREFFGDDPAEVSEVVEILSPLAQLPDPSHVDASGHGATAT
jgi:DNA-binding MarR family transcriptional regulator